MANALTYGELIDQAYWSVSIYRGPGEFDRGATAFPRPIIDVLAIHWCMSEVRNGGFWQFFENDTGVLAPQAVEGFRAVGRPEVAEVVAAAMERMGRPYPRERADRMDLLAGSGDQLSKDLDDCDKRFYELTDDQRFETDLLAYLKKHLPG